MKLKEKLTIAIDGYSSCGKSTLAKELARELGYLYIDSGAMYRAVTLYCIDNNLVSGDHIHIEKLQQQIDSIHIEFRRHQDIMGFATWLNGRNVEKRIREIAVSNLVSPVSKLAFVREALVKQQRELGRNKEIVMDGRDIGTVVFPDAEVKIFMTATPEIRAQRRFDELMNKGTKASMEEIINNIRQRDYIDSHRDISPLRQAEDAVVLDNSYLSREEQLQWALDLVKKKANKV